jgi:hypothetical protein
MDRHGKKSFPKNQGFPGLVGSLLIVFFSLLVPWLAHDAAWGCNLGQGGLDCYCPHCQNCLSCCLMAFDGDLKIELNNPNPTLAYIHPEMEINFLSLGFRRPIDFFIHPGYQETLGRPPNPPSLRT